MVALSVDKELKIFGMVCLYCNVKHCPEFVSGYKVERQKSVRTSGFRTRIKNDHFSLKVPQLPQAALGAYRQT
jgi:hypothetical protein